VRLSSTRPLSRGFAVALAAAALALSPAVAHADDTPTVTTTSPAPTVTTSTSSSSTSTSSATSTSSSGSTSAPATTDGSTTSTTSPSSATTTTSATGSATSTTSASAAKSAESLVPFGRATSRLAKALPGGSSAQADYAAGFVARTLAAGDDHYNYPGSTYFDGGNTIDAILGLDGAGVGRDQADAAYAYLVAHLGDYDGANAASQYAGPTAKALLAVVVHGGDPTDVNGVNLVQALDDALGAVEPGRYSDLPVDCGFAQCDYSNTTGQSLALIAVGRATGEIPEDALQFLLAQQCPDGGFRGDPSADGCTSDADATAFAAQAVLGAGEDDAAGAALDFLAGHQQANGGLVNQDGQVNANTTAVAGQAFAAAGMTDELTAAQGFLASLQMDCTFAAGLRGGVAFTAADYSALKADPGNADALGRAERATTQSTLALAGGSLLDVTKDGATAATPAPSCSTATSTSSTSSTTTHAGAPGTRTPAAPATDPGSLAFTGAQVWPLALIALALILVGALALVSTRRRGGAHA